MSQIPTQLVYAGIWNATTRYLQYWYVVSPINNKAYAYTELQPITGGPDPSVQPSALWLLITPSTPSGAGVSSLNTETGDVVLSSSNSSITISHAAGVVDLTTYTISGVQTVEQLTEGIGGITVNNIDPVNPVLSLNIEEGNNIEIVPAIGYTDGRVNLAVVLPVNEDTYVQYNAAGALYGGDDFTFNEGTLSVPTVETPALQSTYNDLSITSVSNILLTPSEGYSVFVNNGTSLRAPFLLDTNGDIGTLGQVPINLGPIDDYAWQWGALPNEVPTLYNKLMITPTPTFTSQEVVNWSTSTPANQFVPLDASTTTTPLAPIAPPAGETGWRFTKTYTLTPVSSSQPLVSGNTYTIVAPATVNWTAIGAAASTAGTQFTYNGAAITGTGGSVTTNQKMSWYSQNALYGLSLPQTLIPTAAVTKANLKSAWFLVKFNQDIALQGSLAIQIETYAYQYGSNTTNNYTGRWAYSFPLSQGVGFNAGIATNITTAAGLLYPRLKAGFTYLLYAGDITPTTLSVLSGTYQTGGANLFAPSQVSTSNTLRDPFDLFTQYPHFGLTSCQYTPNATQPPYGIGNPYSDPADVEVASIYLNTSSTCPTSGVGQTIMDYQILNMGWSGDNDSNQAFFYINQFLP